MNGHYEKLKDFMEKHEIGSVDRDMNRYDNMCRYNYCIPLRLSKTKDEIIDRVLVDDNEKLTAVRYNIYNSQSIIDYYARSLKHLNKELDGITLPNNIVNIVDKLKLLLGDIDHIEKHTGLDEKDEQMNELTINIGSKYNTSNDQYATGSIKFKSKDNKNFMIGDLGGKNVHYDSDTKILYVDKFKIIQTEQELLHLVESTKNVKSRRMIDNMCYYVKGIDYFLVGYDDDFKQGSSCFPKSEVIIIKKFSMIILG